MSSDSVPALSLSLEEPSTATPQFEVRAREDYQPPEVRRAELILGPTGPFRPLLERYMATVAPGIYAARDLVKVRGDLAKFLRFVVQEERISELDQIRPSTVTRFIEKERERGIRTHLFLGRIATFFVWLISLELYDRGNPVINRLHRRLMHEPPVSPTMSA